MFDILYRVEYVILLSFGFSSDVKVFAFQTPKYLHILIEMNELDILRVKNIFQDLIDQKRKPIIVSVILVLSFLALALKLFYYLFMHVWSKVKKKLIMPSYISSKRLYFCNIVSYDCFRLSLEVRS